MTSDESIMVEMLERATNPGKDSDELSIQMFCIVVKSNQSLIHKAHEMIIDKIKNYNVQEAIKSISLLEECMTKCGSEFQEESAKFRFLNELIRLVSEKYQGAETPKAIKQRIMECLLLWTAEYPKKTKIREAYDMLCKEGLTDKTEAISSTATKRETVLGIDEEMLTKLLKSGNPEDLKRANLHIQYRVNQEARRTELIAQHKSELQEVQTTITLLNQMLDSYYEGDPDVTETLKMLYINCKKHKPILSRMPELLEESNEELIAETLEASDLLQSVMNRFKQTTQQASKNVIFDPSTKMVGSDNTALLTDLLGNSEVATSAIPSVTQSESTNSAPLDNLEELSNIFKTAANATDNLLSETILPITPNKLCNYSSVLLPSKIIEKIEENTGNQYLQPIDDNRDKTKRHTLFGLSEIDKLSEELLKQNLNKTQSVRQFVKDTKKPTLNDLAKENPQHQLSLCSESQQQLTADVDAKDEILDFGLHQPNDVFRNCELVARDNNEPVLHVKHLSDIIIDLDEIMPTSEERVLYDDTELQMKMIYTLNRPTKNVSVIVITVTNKSNLHIKDLHIEASVKKPCKVRLLPATDTNLQPHKPFRPSTPINQILLLYNATGANVDITLLMGYIFGDDPDPIKESIFAKDIPFVK